MSTTSSDFQDLLKKAKGPIFRSGDQDAQYKVGLAYATGQIVSQNNEEALRWLKKAAEQGHPEAQYELGCICNTEHGSIKRAFYDYHTGNKWYKKAAKQGHVKAQCELGLAYCSGNWYLEKDLKAGVELIQSAADQGYAEAQFSLGWAHAMDLGAQEDYRKATEWYRKAAAQGHVKAKEELVELEKILKWIEEANNGDKKVQHELARAYRNGSHIKVDLKKSLELQVKVADSGDPEALYELGNFAYNRQYGLVESAAFTYFLRAATLGHKEAQVRVGDAYGYGYFGVTRDKEKAIFWYKKAEEQGHEKAKDAWHTLKYGTGLFGSINATLDALSGLQSAMESYYGLPHKSGEFLKLCEAARSGDKEAQLKLGKAYDNGEGTPKDQKVAFEWYHKAAEQGQAEAEYILGNAYQNGTYGVVKNNKTAYSWYQKALQHGHGAAKSQIDKKEIQEALLPDKIQELIKKAKIGDGVAAFEVGAYYEQTQVVEDKKLAFEWYQRAAELGVVEAIHNLGVFYYNGYGIAQDKKKAFECYRQAAELGLSLSQLIIGCAYYKSDIIEKDLQKAQQWTERAALQGMSAAQLFLGSLYRDHLIERNLEKAKYWFEKAANQGDLEATAQLGICYYYSGKAEEQIIARALFEKAVNGGNDNGHIMLEMMKLFGTPDQKVTNLTEHLNQIKENPLLVNNANLHQFQQHLQKYKEGRSKVTELNTIASSVRP